jgi:hypothetical protein
MHNFFTLNLNCALYFKFFILQFSSFLDAGQGIMMTSGTIAL